MPGESFDGPGEDENKGEGSTMKSLEGKTIGTWQVKGFLSAGANGAVLRVKKEGMAGVMKIPLKKSMALKWETHVMQQMQAPTNLEVRNWNVVRVIDNGTAEVKEYMGGKKFEFVVMENVPDNPVGVCREGDDPAGRLCEFGNQFLKAIYDMHQAGYIHRDLKPENMGLYDNRILVLYDLGMARRYLGKDGRVRAPRSYCGMRGTEEWASLWAEEGRDQGRVDDLFGFLYVLNEWVNCTCDYPQAWSFVDESKASEMRLSGAVRNFMKWENFPSHLTLENCPPAFYRIKLYLHTLGQADTPDYYFIAQLLNETRRQVKRKNKSSANDLAEFTEEVEFLERQFL